MYYGSGFVAKAAREWITPVGAKTAYIEPGSPWENGYCESFNSKLRDELLKSEIFFTLTEAQIVIESWRRHYNTARPHSSLGYKPPALEVLLWLAAQPNQLGPPLSLERPESRIKGSLLPVVGRKQDRAASSSIRKDRPAAPAL
jgi:hypothetical protein